MSCCFSDKALWGMLYLAGSQNLPISILPYYRKLTFHEIKVLEHNTSTPEKMQNSGCLYRQIDFLNTSTF